jgi:hypothetical protein
MTFQRTTKEKPPINSLLTHSGILYHLSIWISVSYATLINIHYGTPYYWQDMSSSTLLDPLYVLRRGNNLLFIYIYIKPVYCFRQMHFFLVFLFDGISYTLQMLSLKKKYFESHGIGTIKNFSEYIFFCITFFF